MSRPVELLNPFWQWSVAFTPDGLAVVTDGKVLLDRLRPSTTLQEVRTLLAHQADLRRQAARRGWETRRRRAVVEVERRPALGRPEGESA